MSEPNTVEGILARADRLAREFASHTPTPRELVHGPMLADLHHAVLAELRADAKVMALVHQCRRAGFLWESIGPRLGLTDETALTCYGEPESTMRGPHGAGSGDGAL